MGRVLEAHQRIRMILQVEEVLGAAAEDHESIKASEGGQDPQEKMGPLVPCGQSQNTVPIASTQVAIKGIIQYSMRARSSSSIGAEQLATSHSREHTLSAVGPDAPVE